MVSAARAAKDPDWAFVPLGAMFLSLSEMWHMSKPVKKGFHVSNFWVILETCPNLWWYSCSKCYAIDCFGTYFKHVRTCDDVRVQSATQSTASVHTWNMSKPVMTFVFKVLRNKLLQYILETCPNLWWRSCSSATQSTASVHTSNMSEPVMTFVFKVLRNRLLRYILETCPNLWWRSCSKCYAIDCFSTFLKHVQTCDDVRVQVLRNRLLRYILQTCPKLWWRSCSKCYAIDCFGTYFKHVQTCDDVRVQSATQSTASVHTWNMSKSVMTFVFKVLRNRLLQYILETCPNLWWRSCSSATQSTASVHTSNMSKPVMTFLFEVLRNRLLRYILQTCPNLWWRSCSKCYAIDCFGAYLKHVQICDDVRVQSATQSTASVHKKKKKKKKGASRRPNREPRAEKSGGRKKNKCSKSGSFVAYVLQPCKTMYILCITTKYLWELRVSERARPRTRNVVV